MGVCVAAQKALINCSFSRASEWTTLPRQHHKAHTSKLPQGRVFCRRRPSHRQWTWAVAVDHKCHQADVSLCSASDMITADPEQTDIHTVTQTQTQRQQGHTKPLFHNSGCDHKHLPTGALCTLHRIKYDNSRACVVRTHKHVKHTYTRWFIITGTPTKSGISLLLGHTCGYNLAWLSPR